MKIKNKVLISILGTCLFAIILIIVINLINLLIMKNKLVENQENGNQEIHKTTVDSMEKYAKNFAIVTNESYSKNVDTKLEEISSDVLAIKLSLEELYKNNAIVSSNFKGNNLFLLPNIKIQNIKSEYEKIKTIEHTINNIIAKPSKNITVFYASESGFMISNKNVDFSSSLSLDRRERDWYKGAKEKGNIFWTDVYNDSITGEPMVTCSAPVYFPDNKLAGVVEEDVEISRISTEILKQDSNVISYAFLTDKSGKFIIGSDKNKDISTIIDQDKKEKLFENIKNQNLGSIIEDNLIAGFSHIQNSDWNLAILLDYEKVIKPADIIISSIEEVNIKDKDTINNQILSQLILNLINLLAIGLISLFISRKISSSLTKPINKLEKGVKIISSGNLDSKINVKSKDEIGLLAKAFNDMTIKLKNLIKKVSQAVAKEQKIGAELNIAKTIQSAMLPSIFPAFPNRKDIDVYASMKPAKKVGGDFYDFYFIDEENIAFVIADVSGKGVPAALFMVIAKTLIKDRASTKISPSEIFEKVNKRLCENNGAEMFLTCFFAILNLTTGKISFSNAGHNLPLIYRKEKKEFDWLKTKPKFVLAAFPNIKYNTEEIQISHGDIIFFYTDGVTEALNPEKELYSDQRLINELNKNIKNKSPKKIIEEVSKSLSKFVKDAEQSDDITMLSFLFKNPESDTN